MENYTLVLKGSHAKMTLNYFCSHPKSQEQDRSQRSWIGVCFDAEELDVTEKSTKSQSGH